MQGRSKSALLAGAIAAIALCGATRSSGQQAATEQQCVYMGDVRRTAILDDNNILFYMRNGTVYQNHLRNTCFMLRSANRFTYGSTGLRRLCVGDLIQVLPESSFGGAPFPMATCSLGSYLPIDKDVADDLLATSQGKKSKEGRSRQVMKTEPVELPPDKPPGASAAPPAATPSGASPASPPPTSEPPKP
ncbi:MAG TPA: hypothetical protein VMV37_07710 [Gammaproteobacteria bacterium]|nr:hypothetical protein [Gammaproteobacteria bacterium]